MPRAPFVKGSRTSELAADLIEEAREPMAKRIFDRLASTPSTCHEVESALGFKHQTASARFNDLVNAGCIRKTGETRQTDTAEAEVYECIPGVPFEVYKAWQAAMSKNKKTKADTSLFEEAGRQYAMVAAFGTEAEAREAARQLLHAAIRTFPANGVQPSADDFMSLVAEG